MVILVGWITHIHPTHSNRGGGTRKPYFDGPHQLMMVVVVGGGEDRLLGG